MKYLVVGPEASGTHYVLGLLRLNVNPGDEVHHRSMPLTCLEGDPRQPDYHGPRQEVWPNIDCYCRGMGPTKNVTIVLCWRHPDGTKRGQVRAGWSRDEEEADKKLLGAWQRIGRFMAETKYPFLVCTYESLETRQGREAFLAQIQLPLKQDKEFVNGNTKYWAD